MKNKYITITILSVLLILLGIFPFFNTGIILLADAGTSYYVAEFYEENGIDLITSFVVYQGSACSSVTPSEKTGYNFTGWTFTKGNNVQTVQDITAFVFDEENLGEDYLLGSTIKFLPKYSPQTFKMSFVIPIFTKTVNGEKLTFSATKDSLDMSYDQEITPQTILAPQIEHYSFVGWYDDAKYTTSSKTFIVSGDKTLYGRYEQADGLVTFIYGDKTNIKHSVFVPIGNLPTPPEVPNTESKKFSSWEPKLQPAKDGDTYTAVYTNLYSYTYYADGIQVGTYTSEPSKAPTATKKDGYSFSHYEKATENGYDFIFTAVYAPNLYELNIDAPEYISYTTSSEPYFGTEITVTLKIPNGTTLIAFNVDGINKINYMVGNTYSFTMPADDVEIKIAAINSTINNPIIIPTIDEYVEGNSDNEVTKENELSGGEIAAIVVASVIFALAATALALYIINKYKPIKFKLPQKLLDLLNKKE